MHTMAFLAKLCELGKLNFPPFADAASHTGNDVQAKLQVAGKEKARMPMGLSQTTPHSNCVRGSKPSGSKSVRADA